MRNLFIGLSLAAISSTAAFAVPSSAMLTLKAQPAEAKTIIDGAVWNCRETSCMASNVRSSLAMRNCKRVAAELGEVASFSQRGKTLSENELGECNKSAKKA